jgi:hypothetical protein
MGAGAMTRDDIIRLAREVSPEPGYDFPNIFALERFAALVAAAEREACAKVCEDIPVPQGPTELTHIPTLERCAAAIRARGDK